MCALRLLLFLNRAYYLTRNNAEKLIELDVTAMEREIVSFRPPALPILDAVRHTPSRARLRALVLAVAFLCSCATVCPCVRVCVSLSVVPQATFMYHSLFSTVMIGLENIPLDEIRAGK